ncbi:MAG: DUF2085 domain-containing protein [Anaerolineales bacterium]
MSAFAATSSHMPKRSIFQWIGDHWFATFLIVYGAWVFAPFLAPVFMHLGLTSAGKMIYFIYSFFCHQLPERSFFFFGQKSMYSLSEIQAAWQNTLNPMLLRQFTGNENMGWKVAWSDRMISFYTSVWLFAVIWYPLRRRIKLLPWWGFVLLLLPIIIDGGTHTISDLSGIGQGFRDTNGWLAALTNHIFPATFYVGDALGSFNSIMRFLTGLLAGTAIGWLLFPFVFSNQEPDTISYGKVSNSTQEQDPHSARG